MATQPPGLEWSIQLAGRGLYRFRLGRPAQVVPNQDLLAIEIPDSTPEIVNAYALSDEQALLAIVRYNRLVDIFLGITAYSLQNHLRTTVPNIGQIEIDEVYMGLDRRGRQYIVPVQAKGGSDRLSTEQTRQDLEFCRYRFPSLICRSVSAQFLDRATVALFELAVQDSDIRIAEEKHYRLVPAAEIGEDDLRLYSHGG